MRLIRAAVRRARRPHCRARKFFPFDSFGFATQRLGKTAATQVIIKGARFFRASLRQGQRGAETKDRNAPLCRFRHRVQQPTSIPVSMTRIIVPTTYEIHPAIGIARVGSSELSTDEGYFIGPEPDGSPPAQYRDPEGNLKRQAAHFRVFECERDDQNQLQSAIEVTLETAQIRWIVHLANRKGVARRRYIKPAYRNWARNDDTADQALIIDPGERTVSAPGVSASFDTGKFRSTPVDLGAIVMESTGRLLVLGGHGKAGSDPPQPRLDAYTGHFADNDNWYDDTSDGPVVALLTLPDGTVQAATAWVIVAPPDYAPGIKNFVTLYDYLFDKAVARGVLTAPIDQPGGISFTRHVQPILSRVLGYQWVNRAARFGYCRGGQRPRAERRRRLLAAMDGARRSVARVAAVAVRARGLLRNPDRNAPAAGH